MSVSKTSRIFQNALLIDGVREEPIDRAMVVVEGSQIAYAGAAEPERFLQFKDAEIVDLKGMTLMPGLIDANVHLGLNGSPNYFQVMMTETAALAAVRAVKKVNALVSSGFTTIRTLGDKGHSETDHHVIIRPLPVARRSREPAEPKGHRHDHPHPLRSELRPGPFVSQGLPRHPHRRERRACPEREH